MKNTYSYLLLALVAGCAQPDKPTYEEAISSLVQQRLNDPASYESVSFVREPYTRNDSAFQATKDIHKRFAEVSEFATTVGAGPGIEKALADQKALLAEQQRLQGIISHYPLADSVGLLITHRYRAKNAFNATMLQKARFLILGKREPVLLLEEE